MRLFVGNLPWTSTEAEVTEAFGEMGFQVASVKLIVDRETGRSRGFGFVELVNPDAAQDAIALMNRMNVGGRPLVVAPANERKR